MVKSYIHSSFAIHGRSISFQDLTELSYSFIKEGDEYEKHIGEFILDWIDDSATISVNTSGSTGVPKSIVLTKEHMVNSALATGAYFNLSSISSALLCLPATYIAGKMMLVRAMVLGLDIYFVPPTSNPLENVNKSFDFGAMVPLQVGNSLQELHQIECLIIGGAPISTSLRKELKNISNTSYETYGMTETITHIAIKPLNNHESDDASFSVLPDVDIRKDERNCLVIDAPKISDKTVITNDVVDLVSKTEFKWLGRYDNIINSGGVKLNPEQIETKLSNIIAQPFFIGSLSDSKLGEQLVLCVEGTADADSIMKVIKSSKLLSKFEIPKQIKLFPEFLRTSNGKIKRIETMDLVSA